MNSSYSEWTSMSNYICAFKDVNGGIRLNKATSRCQNYAFVVLFTSL